MKNPTFSVCIPNYNYAGYIGRTIQSVLDQSYPHFEIIVADNASTDDSVAVVESFKDDRIRLIRNRYNIGFAPNLQRATMYAQNDFVNLLSSDDMMNPEALATYAEVLKKQGERAGHTVLLSDVEVIDSNDVVSYVQGRNEETFRGVRFDAAEAARRALHGDIDYAVFRGKDILAMTLRKLRTFAPFLTIVYPRSFWQAVEGYNSVRTIGPDKHFNFKLLALDPDVVYVRHPLFRYRVHGSPNQKAGKQTLKQQIDDYLYTIEYGDDFLASLSIEQNELIRELVGRVCLKNGLSQLAHGAYSQAFRLLAFSLAAYPGETFKQPRTYVLAGLLMLGPFGSWLAQALYRLRRTLNSAKG